ncbi:MAG: AAA family ATPase [Candidatus Pacebacteria bacterium]|nr:AAA family ATPase [Candidatus Paceibacterota bacterium]
MKLKKIKKIKEYKSFQDFTWQPFMGDENFHDEVNIFYGENGSGKSSICNILKNVLAGDVIFNNEFGYKSFGKHAPREVCLEFDAGECRYLRKVWNEPEFNIEEDIGRSALGDWWDKKTHSNDAILFFDREFVSRNVHEYERKTTKKGQEQQSGKLIIEFDSKAISLRDIRDEAKKYKEEQDQKLKGFDKENKEVFDYNLTKDEEIFFSKYDKRPNEEIEKIKRELSEEKKEAEKKLEKDRELQKKTSSIQNDINNLSVGRPNLILSDYQIYQDLFDFDLKEQVEIVAEQSLIEKIKINKLFFETGIGITRTHQKQCPFCQSEKEEEGVKKIIGLYNQIYDTTYKAQMLQFEKNKQSLVDELSKISQTLFDFDLRPLFIELKKLDQNYKIPNIYLVEDENIYEKPADREIKELRDKISSLERPNKEGIQELYAKAVAEYETIKKFFQDIIAFVDQKNALIGKFKTDNTDEKLQLRIAVNMSQADTINKELSFINGTKITEQKKKKEKEKERQVMQTALDALKMAHTSALKEYEDYCTGEVFLNQLAKIQEYFINFHFSFQLALKTDSARNKTEFPFAFKILDLEGNERDFKEGLSEGEVQVLSLCFFFAFLDIQKNKEEKILVFDDPISSLDNSNLGSLVDLIAQTQEKFSQTFVFTHHRTFFKFLQKQFNTTQRKKKKGNEYNIIRNQKEFGGSFLCPAKAKTIRLKLINFEKDIQSLAKNGGFSQEEKAIEYGQYLRYEVEDYLKNGLLHWNAPNCGSIIELLIKNSEPISKENLKKLKDVYSFCNWTTSHVDVGDDHGFEKLKTKITEFLTITKTNSE